MNLRRIYLAVVGLGIALGGTPALAVLTGEYLFENNLLDTSGSVRNGTFAVNGAAGGTPTFVAGLYPGSTSAIQMNTDGLLMPNRTPAESVLLPANANFIRNAPGATLMAWVRLDGQFTDGGNQNRTIISINNGAAPNGSSRATLQVIDGGDNDHQLRVGGRVADSGNFQTTNSGATAVPLGEAVFLAGVLDYVGNSIRAYINGQLVGQNTNPGWSTNSADTANLFAEIGSVATPSATTQEYWPGVIDGARIFNTALSDEQIMDLYLDYSAIPDPLVPGDVNGDGFVTAADLTPIRQNYRLSGKARTEGDLTGDTIVDWLDFRQWKTEYLNTLTAGGGSLAGVNLSFLNAGQVPEPPTAALVLAVGITAWGRRKKRVAWVANSNGV